jgi:hypothetical protein
MLARAAHTTARSAQDQPPLAAGAPSRGVTTACHVWHAIVLLSASANSTRGLAKSIPIWCVCSPGKPPRRRCFGGRRCTLRLMKAMRGRTLGPRKADAAACIRGACVVALEHTARVKRCPKFSPLLGTCVILGLPVTSLPPGACCALRRDLPAVRVQELLLRACLPGKTRCAGSLEGDALFGGLKP